jgi:uncharacterized protein
VPRYHLRRADREIKDPAEIAGLIRQGRFAVVALCRENEPYLVALNYGHDSERNSLYFHCAAKGLKLDFVRANPQACAVIIEDLGYIQAECDHHYRSVVIWGSIGIVDDLTEKRHAVDVMQRHLEDNPETVRQKSPVTDDSLLKTAILRLDIRDVTAKRNI